MSHTRSVITAVYLDADAFLEIGQDYRVMVSGLILTIPTCEAGDFIVIDVLVDQTSDATVLTLAPSVTVDGHDSDINLNTNVRTYLCATGTNTWARI